MWTNEFRSTQSFVLLSPYCSLVSCAIFGRMQPSKPAGWDAFHGLALAREKLSSEEIQQQMKELGVEMEIVPLI